MKKSKLALLSIILVGILGVVFAADHIDAPAVQGGNSDITDFYAFQGENTNNLVFVANMQGLLSPSSTSSATFDENVLLEFNIDNTGDNVEDLVIQAIPSNGRMYFFGPVSPSQTGLNSTILTANASASVAITPYGSNVITETSNGIQVFAGPAR